MQETGRQSRCTGTTLRDGMWRERGLGGRWEGVQDGGHMYTHGRFMSMYGKNHHNIGK